MIFPEQALWQDRPAVAGHSSLFSRSSNFRAFSGRNGADALNVNVASSKLGKFFRMQYSRVCCSDRKSTRLNSSHEWISYAVFCLKKKKNKNTTLITPEHQKLPLASALPPLLYYVPHHLDTTEAPFNYHPSNELMSHVWDSSLYSH